MLGSISSGSQTELARDRTGTETSAKCISKVKRKQTHIAYFFLKKYAMNVKIYSTALKAKFSAQSHRHILRFHFEYVLACREPNTNFMAENSRKISLYSAAMAESA